MPCDITVISHFNLSSYHIVYNLVQNYMLHVTTYVISHFECDIT